MVAWQEIEVVRIGPAVESSGALRDRIYSWPIVSSCAVDQEVMARWTSPQGYDLSTKLTNRRGLAALEYVLFAPTLESSCPPQSVPAGWSALSEDDRRAARCGFVATAAADLAAQSQALVDGWSSFAPVLAQAGSPFRTAHEAVNRVSDGLFVLDTDVKDMKIAEPAGIALASCGTLGQPCPQELESPWSSHAKENILADLRGFRAIFTGGGGPGFDDFLRARGAAELAATMEADLEAALAAVAAIPGTLAVAITTSPDEVRAAHAAVKKITDALKSQFLTVLALELPADLGDDGD
jgi:predicted lipoprotein